MVADALKKKLDALQMSSPLAKLSNQIRETPLMQFINPATKVQQVVLSFYANCQSCAWSSKPAASGISERSETRFAHRVTGFGPRQ